MESTLTELEQEMAEEGTDLGVEVEQAIENDKKKHARKPILIDGVPHERVWGYALFPAQQVRDLNQYCRDTGRKLNDLIGPIIAGGMDPVFNEVTSTAADRAKTRKAVGLPNSEEALAKAEQKLISQQEKLQAQLEAVKARAAALRGAAAPAVGGDAALAQVLGEGNGQEHKHGKDRK